MLNLPVWMSSGLVLVFIRRSVSSTAVVQSKISKSLKSHEVFFEDRKRVIPMQIQKRATATATVAFAALLTLPATATAETTPANECAPNPSAHEISEANAQLNREHQTDRGGWTYAGGSNFSPCADLSYAITKQGGQGNGAETNVLLLFHKGQFIGIDSNHPQTIERITPNDDGTFTVVYRDTEAQMEAGAPNADADKFVSEVTYFWDGDKVGHHGTIPNESLPEF